MYEKKGSFKFVKAYTGQRKRDYNLCDECKQYLEDESNEPKNIWPVFLWYILSGSNKFISLENLIFIQHIMKASYGD